MKNQEKAQLGAETVKHFVDQFGEPDDYSTILVEILMEELWNVPPVHLLSESVETGDQTTSSDSIEPSSELPDLQCE